MKERDQNALTSHTVSDSACTLQVTHCSYISRTIHDKTKLNPDAIFKFWNSNMAWQLREVRYFRKPNSQCHSQKKQCQKHEAVRSSPRIFLGWKRLLYVADSHAQTGSKHRQYFKADRQRNWDLWHQKHLSKSWDPTIPSFVENILLKTFNDFSWPAVTLSPGPGSWASIWRQFTHHDS